MPESIKKITDGTLVSLGLVVVLIGGVLWLASIQSDAKEARTGLQELKQSNSDYIKVMNSIDERLSRIEGEIHQMRNGK